MKHNTHFKVHFYLLLLLLPFLMSFCPTPSNFEVTETGYSHIILDWNGLSNAENYLLRIRENGSTNENDWVEIFSATDDAILFAEPCESYEVQVKANCDTDETSDYSASVIANTAGCFENYCYSYGNITAYEWINQVELGSISNSSGNNYGYENFTNLSTDVVQGESYSINLSPGFADESYAEYWRVWIDYNQDNDFTDANELVFDSMMPSTANLTGSISIPETAPSGTTRMRVSMKFLDFDDITPPYACENISIGEVEDYSINIVTSCSNFTPQIITTAQDWCSQNEGSVTVLGDAGGSPFAVSWDTGSNATSLVNLPAGNYTATVTDENGCTFIGTTEVLSNIPLTLNLINQNTSCGENNGSIQANTIGGGGVIEAYNWSHDANLSTATASSLSAGIYGVTITDIYDCTTSAQTTIQNTSELVLQSIDAQNAACGQANGSASISVGNATGNLNYQWSHNSTLNTAMVGNLLAGIYQVTVTDATGCSLIASTTVNNDGAPSVVFATNATAFCGEDGKAFVSIGGGTLPYAYLWNDGQTNDTAFNLNPGTYTVTVSDANNCQLMHTVTVEGGIPLSIGFDVTEATCGAAVGGASIFQDGGTFPFDYAWSNNTSNPSLQNVIGGEYFLTVTDANNCVTTTSVTIPFSDEPSITALGATNASCGEENGALTVFAVNNTGGPLSYSLNGFVQNTAVFTDLPPNDYILSVTDANNCSTDTSFVIEALPLPELSVGTVSASTCSSLDGVAMPISTVPVEEYVWSNGSFASNQNNLQAGTYSLTITDENGCNATIEFDITPTTLPELVFPDTVLIADTILSTTLDATLPNATAYTWSNGSTSPTIEVEESGIYSVTVTIGICEAVASTVVNAVVTGIGDERNITKYSNFQLFPNPSVDRLYLDWSNTVGQSNRVAQIRVLNSIGQVIYSTQTLSNTPSTHIIELSAWQAGVYFVVLETTDGERVVRQFAKAN